MKKIIKASERQREDKGAKIVIAGKAGVGKTSLLYTLTDSETLFMDFEAGDLALEKNGGWKGDTIRPKTWQEARDFACYFGGPNPSLGNDQPYSQAHYDHMVKEFGNPESEVSQYNTLFIDSITVAGRLCFRWCKQQDEVYTDKTKKINNFAVYGLHGREMMDWLTQLQHIRDKNIIFVGILDEYQDEFNQAVYSLQIEGSKTGRELPGIVDEVLTMHIRKDENGRSWREFVCHTDNEWKYPAKDRSGLLKPTEEPHLGKLLQKLIPPKDGTITQKFDHTIPEQPIKKREVA